MPRPDLRTLLGVAVVALGLTPAWGAALTLDSLMQALRAAGARTVQFEEVRQMVALDVPLISRGELEFRPPDYLRRTTVVQDLRNQVEIDGDQVRVVRDGKQERYALEALPGVGGFALSLRAVLGGDAETLRNRFDVDFGGTLDEWSLALRPKRAEERQWMREIRFAGEEGSVRRIEILEESGDRVVTTLRP